MFKRSGIFNADDHLFRLEVKKIGNKEPFLTEIVTDLANILELAIEHLQKIYTKENEHHIYISFSQNTTQFVGITTGTYFQFFVQ